MGMGYHPTAQQLTPLLAPVPRRPVPDLMAYHPLSAVPSSGTIDDALAQNDFVSGIAQSLADPVSDSVSNTSSPLQPRGNSHSLSWERPLNPNIAPGSSQLSQSSPGTHNHTYNGPVTVINNSYHISVPVTQGEKKDSKPNWLKRAAVQRYQRFRGNEGAGSSAAGASTSSSTQNIVSHIRSSLENLTIGGRQYVTAADMTRSAIDEAYDSTTSPESPDTNAQLLAELEEAGNRLRTPTQDPYQPSCSDQNGSPASFRHPPLHLVTPRSPASSFAPARRPVPPNRASSLQTDPRDAGVPQDLPTHNQRLGISNANFADQGALTHSHTPGPAQFGQNEQLSHRLLAASDRPRLPPPTYLRPPEPDVELTATEPTQYAQYPVVIPDADRHSNDTPSSTFAEPDTPDYQQNALARRHNPPRMTDWGNVPAAHDSLAFVNSRAMMGVDRFGHDTKTQMPTLPALAGDRENVVKRKATPNTRAKEAEKEAQKSMKGKM